MFKYSQKFGHANQVKVFFWISAPHRSGRDKTATNNINHEDSFS
jgi:hypothetical protein